jgi:D-inositol-3-phosphate glycosyltransferase
MVPTTFVNEAKQRVELPTRSTYIANPMNRKQYRIASYCSSPAWGGLEMNVLRMLCWLKERGWDTVFYGNPETRLYQEAIREGFRTSPIVTRLRSGDLVNAWRLARRMRHDNVHWLVVHRSPDYFLGAFARIFSGSRIRLISQQHMHIGGRKKDPYHVWLYRRFDAFVTPVQWLADRVLEKTSVPSERIHIIPFGTEIACFTSGRPSREAARNRFGLPLDQPVLGLIGRLDPKKGQDVAVEALAQLGQSGCRPHLLIIGDQSFNEGDEFTDYVHALVDKHGLKDQVHFFPHTPDVAWAYAALDLFLMASKSECYGMVTVEAFLSAVPVIGTNDGGTVDLVHPGQNGLLVEPRNATQLAEAIKSLLDDPELVRRMGQAAHEEAIVKFSHVQQCEAWESLLEELA